MVLVQPLASGQFCRTSDLMNSSGWWNCVNIVELFYVSLFLVSTSNYLISRGSFDVKRITFPHNDLKPFRKINHIKFCFQISFGLKLELKLIYCAVEKGCTFYWTVPPPLPLLPIMHVCLKRQQYLWRVCYKGKLIKLRH